MALSNIQTGILRLLAAHRDPESYVAGSTPLNRDAPRYHDHILPLGAVVWASAGKALGFTPEGIINEIRRVARYTEADFRHLASDPPLDPAATMIRLREILSEAETFAARMPTDKVGLLFLQGTKVVQPDPDCLQEYETHAGQRRGHWPSNAEITAAMFERAHQRGPMNNA